LVIEERTLAKQLKGKKDVVDIHIGQRIRVRRMALGLSRIALGEPCGISFQQIQKYEKGANRVSASRLQQFAKLLDVPVSFFFDGHVAEGSKNDRANDLAQQLFATPEGVALAKAFVAIENRSARRSIITMTEKIAEQARGRAKK
jgi:transcriptional regulator with XRE-family HTH domain